MTNLITPTYAGLVWPPNPGPITQIQPFTYEDGITYTELLYAIKKYLEETIYPAIAGIVVEVDAAILKLINDVSEALANEQIWVTGEINELKQYVDDQVQLIINDSIQVQDPVVAGIFGDAGSDSRGVTDQIYANKATQNTVETGRLSSENVLKNDNDNFYDKQRRQIPPYALEAGISSIRDYDPLAYLYNDSTATYADILRDIQLGRQGLVPCEVIFYGDSKTEGSGSTPLNTLPNRFIHALGALDGTCYARMGLTPGSGRDSRWNINGFTLASDNNHKFFLSATVGLNIAKFTASRFSNGFRIWYGGNSPGTTVSINGGTPVPLVSTGGIIPPGGTANWYYADFGGLTQGNHSVEIVVNLAQGNLFNLLAVEHLHDGKYLTVTNAGSSGSRIDEWMKDNSNTGLFQTTAGRRSLAPGPTRKIAIVQLGTNISPNDVANYPTLIDNFTSHGNLVLIVVPGGTTNTGDRGANKKVMWETASAKFIPLVDFTDLIGDNVEADARGLLDDGLHENARGYILEASKLSRAVSR